tara:strand:+ start:5276 stop:6415 length:1140 start_codon:yes stop_codon:yes gene_type:complete
MKIVYLTYQSFPADTANSMQTISTIKYFVRKSINVKLVFPDRTNYSTPLLTEIQQYYNIDENFEVVMLKHNLPFGKVKFFNRSSFHLSHFFWSWYAVNHELRIKDAENIFFTRSDWVLYFLTRKKVQVVFECHKYSKLRKFIINYCLKFQNSKIIFLNKQLKESVVGFSDSEQILVEGNGYDDDFFDKVSPNKNNHEVIFVGKLLRFNKTRNIEFLIDCFKDQRLENYKLSIIGGPNTYAEKLSKFCKMNNISNVKLYGGLTHAETTSRIQKAQFGILINEGSDTHSLLHTSPLKYFEYLRSEVKVVAVDFQAHRELPFSENISFFNESSTESFISSIIDPQKFIPLDEVKYKKFSIEERTKRVINFIARLEGLEPPTL